MTAYKGAQKIYMQMGDEDQLSVKEWDMDERHLLVSLYFFIVIELDKN